MFLFVYIAAALACLSAFAFLPMAWPAKLGLSLILGWCFGSFGFLAHEVLHGSIITNVFLQNLLASIMMVPYMVSPTFWRYWHNRLHHSKTQQLLADPDAFPTMKIYRHSKFMQFMFPFTPGSQHKRSYGYFFFWFSFNTFVAQLYLRFRNKQFEHLNHKRVTAEFALQIFLWFGVLYAVGVQNFFWVGVLPFLIQNYTIMHYISTNHNLSPLTKNNDPLLNSLTVTNYPVLEWLHFNFGYHVEHHIFPTMNAKHAKKVHEILKRDFPETYQYMPIGAAMQELYRTPRIYKDTQTLIHPETLKTTAVVSYAQAPVVEEMAPQASAGSATAFPASPN